MKKPSDKHAPPMMVTLNQCDGAEKMLVCPVCGFEMVHMEPRTVVADGNDNYNIRPNIVRGGVIFLVGWCEAGHRFCICFGFHKGSTYVWAERGVDLSDLEEPPDMR